jgi:hypothetical protein
MAAQRLHVGDILIQHVAFGIAARRAALAAVVEEDELHRLGQRAERGLQVAVVVSRAAMDDESDRPLAHARPVRNEPGSDHVEIDLGISHTCQHGCSPVA